jgi:hypothetical protein
MSSKKIKKKAMGISFLSLFLFALFLQAPLLRGDEEVTIDYEARSGMVVFDKINGKIELRISCSEEVKTTKVYFNDEKVHSEDEGDFKWVFNTKDYSSGSVEIKVVAETEAGDTYETTKDVEFMSERETEKTMTMIIGIIIGVTVAIVAIIVAVILYYKRK